MSKQLNEANVKKFPSSFTSSVVKNGDYLVTDMNKKISATKLPPLNQRSSMVSSSASSMGKQNKMTSKSKIAPQFSENVNDIKNRLKKPEKKVKQMEMPVGPIESDAPTALIGPADYDHIFMAPKVASSTAAHKPKSDPEGLPTIPSDAPTALIAPVDYEHIYEEKNLVDLPDNTCSANPALLAMMKQAGNPVAKLPKTKVCAPSKAASSTSAAKSVSISKKKDQVKPKADKSSVLNRSKVQASSSNMKKSVSGQSTASVSGPCHADVVGAEVPEPVNSKVALSNVPEPTAKQDGDKPAAKKGCFSCCTIL